MNFSETIPALRAALAWLMSEYSENEFCSQWLTDLDSVIEKQLESITDDDNEQSQLLTAIGALKTLTGELPTWTDFEKLLDK